MTTSSPLHGVSPRGTPAVLPAWRPERWLAHVVGWVWGVSTARRALRLATRLYAGTDFKARWRRSRFVIRTLWYGGSSARWYAFIDANPFRRRLTRLQPALAERPHRPYRRFDLDVGARVACLVSHGLALEQLGWQQLVLRMGVQAVTIAHFIGKDGVERRLVLSHPGQFMKEGELCLHLCSGATRLYSAAFSLVGAFGSPAAEGVAALDIGCLQGPDDPAARELVRSTTKALHGLRPRDLMVTALKMLAEAAHAPTLVGVGGARHVYRHWRKRRKIAFDYDACWAEHAGRPRDDGDYDIAALVTHRPIAELSSNKRAEARRRQALIADIRCQFDAALADPAPGAAVAERSATASHSEAAPRREHAAGHTYTGAHRHIAEPVPL